MKTYDYNGRETYFLRDKHYDGTLPIAMYETTYEASRYAMIDDHMPWRYGLWLQSR